MSAGRIRRGRGGTDVDVVALVGTVAGAVGALGVPIAYLQLRDSRRSALASTAGVPIASVATSGPAMAGLGTAAGVNGVVPPGFSVFAPAARTRGYTVGFVDRDAEVGSLARDVSLRKSVIVIEGLVGAGKTALAASLCQEFENRRETRWVFCAERPLTLNTLARSIAWDPELSSTTALRAAVAAPASPAEVIDQVIAVLAAADLLLVLDDYRRVADPAVAELVDRAERSLLRSTVVLTVNDRGPEDRALPGVARLRLGGLPSEEVRGFLDEHGVEVTENVAERVWAAAGRGNPQAMTLFAGLALDVGAEELLMDLPAYAEDLASWITPLYERFDAETRQVAKAVAFIYEPAGEDLVRAVADVPDARPALQALTESFVLTRGRSGYEMHSSVRDYVDSLIGDAERAGFAARVTSHYQAAAREVFLDGLGASEPSYGLLYIESFPDYFAAADRHALFVDDLLARAADAGFGLAPGARVLVLGSGDGTHDAWLARHGLVITDLDIQPEVVELGRRRAEELNAQIEYVVADMTRPLPDLPALRDLDAVFNIGSSFGYEDADEDNAAVFVQAAAALKPGAPFVFEYVNGPHWEDRRVQRQVDVTTLPDGSVRTESSVTDPESRTALTAIGLRRPDGTGGWFHHFMHYYRIDEVLAMMRAAGLEPLATFGAVGGRVDGRPFDELASEAMVIFAAKKSAAAAD